MCCAKKAEWIDVLFGTETLVDPRHIVFNKGSRSVRMRGSEGQCCKVQIIETVHASDVFLTKLCWPLVSIITNVKMITAFYRPAVAASMSRQ